RLQYNADGAALSALIHKGNRRPAWFDLRNRENNPLPVHKPPRLRPGARIGVIAPAGSVDRAAVAAGVAALRAEGFEAELGANLFQSNGYLAGAAELRARDLLEFFRRPDIDAIFCARGGFGSIQLLPYLQPAQLESPKIFVGYSDITILLNWLRQFCGLVTFHAPMVAMDLARGLSARARKHLWDVLRGEVRQWKVALGEAVKPGRAEGEIAAGCCPRLVKTWARLTRSIPAEKFYFWKTWARSPTASSECSRSCRWQASWRSRPGFCSAILPIAQARGRAGSKRYSPIYSPRRTTRWRWACKPGMVRRISPCPSARRWRSTAAAQL